jgi:hypothetical protein
MSGPDFETLLRSPLDDESAPNGWGSALLGLVGGGVAIVGLSFVLGLWSTPGETSPMALVADTAASATDASIEAANSYLEGFSDVGGSVAMKPVAVLTRDAGFVVSFATTTGRETDPETTPNLLGGRWQLENADGSVTGTTRLVYDRMHTGVIGVEFPVSPDEGDVIRMAERWDADERTASLEIPFTGTPFSTTGSVELDLGEGTTLRLDRLDLGRHLGRIVWTLSGPDDPTGVVEFEVELIDQEGETVGDYRSMPSPRDPTLAAGVADLFWGQGFNVHPDEGNVVRITATVQLVSPEPVDIVYAVDSIPSR